MLNFFFLLSIYLRSQENSGRLVYLIRSLPNSHKVFFPAVPRFEHSCDLPSTKADSAFHPYKVLK